MTDAPLRLALVDEDEARRACLCLRLQRREEIRIVADAPAFSRSFNGSLDQRVDACFSSASALFDADARASARALFRASSGPALVVFSASSIHALQAFDSAALDYLLLPIEEDRLLVTLSKVRRWRSARVDSAEPIESPSHPAIVVKDRGRTLQLQFSEIEWVDAQGNYLRLHTARGVLLHRETMKAFALRVAGSSLVRVHRSAMVNASHVSRIRHVTSGDRLVHLVSGARVRWSRAYRGSDAQAYFGSPAD